MTRKDRIRQGLADCEQSGIVRSWYAQGYMPGLRWCVEISGVGSYTFSTAEVEAFLLGAAYWNGWTS
jgi:hypothetical protein